MSRIIELSHLLVNSCDWLFIVDGDHFGACRLVFELPVLLPAGQSASGLLPLLSSGAAFLLLLLCPTAACDAGRDSACLGKRTLQLFSVLLVWDARWCG